MKPFRSDHFCALHLVLQPMLFWFIGPLLALLVLFSSCEEKGDLVLSCSEENDLFKVLKENKINCIRYSNVQEAIDNSKTGSAVMILADDYPYKTTFIEPRLFKESMEKKLKLFIEFPSYLPGYDSSIVTKAQWERAVISSDAFGPNLKPNRILAIQDCHFVDLPLKKPDIVLARVAGFDSVVYGIPEKVFPILGIPTDGELAERVMVSTTKLSQFVTARYAPTEAWENIWKYVFKWLLPEKEISILKWTPSVRPTYTANKKLSSDAEDLALKRGIEWYFKSKMILDKTMEERYLTNDFPMGDRTGEMPDSIIGVGDGSLGVLEGFMSTPFFDGSQPVRWWRRNDCNGEVAGSIALAGIALNNKDYSNVGGNIGDWLFSSIMSRGVREDPQSQASGLIGWNDVPKYYENLNGYDVYYGDDNSRAILGMILAGAALKTDRFDSRVLRALLANLRLSGKKGFQPDRINHDELVKNGWKFYNNSSNVSFSGNFQAYLWASYLWAFKHTGYRKFLDQAKMGIYNMMDGYPHEWGVTGIQMDRARMLLPLSWLIRIEDTPDHRAWLKMILKDLTQDPKTGAIPEKIEAGTNRFGTGHYKIPKTNEEYGISESPIIQNDGDLCSDLLYAVNFAFIGLHEATAATNDDFFENAEDKLAEFLCRIQIRSDSQPELDGGWFRAFDFNRWEYWASSGDMGWGAWCIESGWSQSWITITLSLRKLKTSFWDFTSSNNFKNQLANNIEYFFEKSE